MDLFEEVNQIVKNSIDITNGINAVEKLAEIKVGLIDFKTMLIMNGIEKDSEVIKQVNNLIEKT